MNLMFRLALFLRDEASFCYKLIPSDITILFILASHLGDKDWWHISQPQLAQECRLTASQIRRRCVSLSNQNLLVIKRTNKANAYGITLPKVKTINSLPDSAPMLDQNQNQKSVRASVRYPFEHQCAIRSSISALHKETLIKLNKTERARKARALPLTDNFMPNAQAKALCAARNVAVELLTQKFIAHSRSQGKSYVDEQAAFELFILGERSITVKEQKGAITNQIPNDEEYALCAGCSRPKYHCSCKLASKETNIRNIRDIMKKLN